MKVSREWLQTYFEKPLPAVEELATALTFHAFEIDGVEPASARGSGVATDEILDVKVTPNRGHDCLGVRGIAKELSAILKLPMKSDPLRGEVSLEPKTNAVKVDIADATLCPRFTGACIKGIKVGPSPEWLVRRLEAVGQKSINNVVDATNYVMFGLGQPLHAFDLGKLKKERETYAMNVRLAKSGEKLVGLDEEEYELDPSMLIIEDASIGIPVSIAGIKGGQSTGIDESTSAIFLEAANWDGVTIRKTSVALKLRTDASERFQQVISPELAAYGLRAASELIVELAGGEIVGFVDEYPRPQEKRQVRVSTDRGNSVLGTKLSDADVADAFTRLGLPFIQKKSEFTVDVPFERIDIEIPEDLIEEVGRITGYENVAAMPLPPFSKDPVVNQSFYAAEKKREELVAQGYSEVLTSVFAEKGERAVANKVGGEKPYLRTTLTGGLKEAYERNTHNKDLLGLKQVRLFEIGTVWKGGEESVMLGTASSDGIEEHLLKVGDVAKERYDDLPLSNTERYHSFSKYPFIVRDIALWVPSETRPEEVLEIIRKEAGELLVHSNPFDQFEKNGKTSYAFRLVFQSFEKTLTDEEANSIMERVAAALAQKGWTVR